MESLAALSLACNVIQIVETSYSVLRVVKELRAPEGGLTTFSEDLRTLGTEIQKSIESQDPASLSLDENGILKQAANMVKVAGDLRTELDKFKASKRGMIINAARYLVKKQKIEGLEKSLQQIDKFMSTRLLANVRQKTIDNKQHIIGQFRDLRTELKEFIVAQLQASGTASAKQTLVEITEQEQKIKEHIESGFATNLEHMYDQSTEARIMLTKQSDQTRAAVYTETGKLHETLEAQMSLMKINISTSGVKEFIGSLRFDEMNQRRNAQTLEHSEGTFEWIFESFEDYDVESESEEEADQTDDDIEDESSEYGSSASEELDYDSDWKYNVNGTPRYQDFCQWLLNEQQLFWISGKAGSGKSTLMRFLVDDGRTSAALNRARPGTLMLHAFIWNPGTDMQKSEKGILCTLLHQVLSADPRAAAKILNSDAQNIQKVSHHDWSVRELRSTFKQAVTLVGRRVCVFVDGLDEAEKLQGDASCVLHLVEFLRTMPGSKLCVSSRPEPVFEKSLQYYPHMRLQDLTYNDIWTFTSNQVFSVRWSYSEYKREELVRRVADSADGVFLWVRLIMNSVLKGITNSDDWELLVKRIDELPTDLTKMYEVMWQRIGEGGQQYHDQAGLSFSFMLRYQELFLRPIGLFNMMLAHEPSIRKMQLGSPSTFGLERPIRHEKRLIQLCRRSRTRIEVQCGGILEVQSNSVEKDPSSLRYWNRSHVHFVHRSARDFLEDQGCSIREDFKMDWGDFFECHVATKIMFHNVIRPRWDSITHDMPNDTVWQIVRSTLFGPIPNDEEDKCLHILHNALQNVPWWQDEKRSFTELLVRHDCISALKGFARSDMEESLRHEEQRNRLLRLACQMHSLVYRKGGYEELVSWILSKDASPNSQVVSSGTNSNSAWLDFLFTANRNLRGTQISCEIQDQVRFHAIAAQFHTRGVDMDSRHVLGASVCDERVLFGFGRRIEDMIFAIIETSSGYCSRCIFHDYDTHVEKGMDLHIDVSTLAWLVDASLPRIKVIGLINKPRIHRSFTAKKIEYSIELDQTNVRRNGLPGSSDIESLKGALGQRELEMLWNESTEAVIDMR
ncbi:putative NACHT domain-containing protein [Seiridium cardinale]|uniref:NACHT domain-containing protein n=1 Tax=Seiridium cardinale TaxID=138064 RepID=A0ABR2XN76_9PEZI